jgi:small-conductance mechanosensitive channel
MQVAPMIKPEDYFEVADELRDQIKNRFDAEGIRFATPARGIALGAPLPTMDG